MMQVMYKWFIKYKDFADFHIEMWCQKKDINMSITFITKFGKGH